MKVVIMAGGKGTRISSIAKDIPKPMIKIGGKPVLEHEITLLKQQGLTDIIITISYLGNVITDYFGDGKKFGVHIEYFYENQPLGNAGALFKLKSQLTEDFLLLNADSMFNIDFQRFIDFHRQKGGLVTLFTHPNSHPYDSSLLITDDNHSVKKWLTKEDVRPKWYKNRVNAGLHIISPKLLDIEIDKQKIDLDRDLLKPLAGTNKMFAYDSPEYVKDMGTPDRFMQVSSDYEKGIIVSKNLCHPQKAIFLDRDGTINKYVGFLRNIEDLELLPTTSDAIRKINNSSYLAIVVTNQPVIARGEVSVENLKEMHNKLETLLGIDGAYLDSIYYCPHHPDKGFDGEIKELKIDCDCRKPKPGMLLKAAKDWHIDLSKSWMIGDDKNDILAGQNAGCRTILIGEKNYDDLDAIRYNDLKEAIDYILEKQKYE